MAWVEQPGYVLHRRPFRETSFLLTLLTPEYGRIEAVARGVRGRGRTQREKQAWLQPFSRLKLRWREKAQTGLVTLSGFEAENTTLLCHESLLCGLYMNELSHRLLPLGLGCETLFFHYEMIIAALSQQTARAAQAWLLRQYELSVLSSIGAQLCLPERFQLDQIYRWTPQEGVVPVLQGISGRCLQALLQGEQQQDCGIEQKRFMQQVLQYWLGTRPLKSQQLWKQKRIKA